MAKSDSESQKFRQYDPLSDLYVPIRSLYNLPTSPEFLFSEEASIQRRSWSENLTYYTGTGYLTGAIIGGVKGSIEGVKAGEIGESKKIRVNRVLNSGGSLGRKYGNGVGVVGLIFAGIESGLVWVRDGKDDLVNSVGAGLGTGVVYRAAGGVRSAAIAGAVGGLIAGLGVAGKQAVKRYVPI